MKCYNICYEISENFQFSRIGNGKYSISGTNENVWGLNGIIGSIYRTLGMYIEIYAYTRVIRGCTMDVYSGSFRDQLLNYRYIYNGIK